MGSTGNPGTYLLGLDSLRFYAALLVLVSHAPSNLRSLGLPAPPDWKLFHGGDFAVPFFFTLSGFLITHLLVGEERRNGRIDVWAFYVRRGLRIWPLYYAVAAAGLALYWLVLPAVGSSYRLEYNPWTIAACYLLFLPHLASSVAFVGGMLTPLWSIGVEEHFYLTWAPLLRRFSRAVPTLCWVAFGLSIGWQALHHWNPFQLDATLRFVLQMKFHYMAIGALLGWAYSERRTRLLGSGLLRNRALQVGLFVVLAIQLLTNLIPPGGLWVEVLQPFVFAALLVEVALNPHQLFSYRTLWTEAAGQRSYAFYLLHMPSIYLCSGVARLLHAERLSAWLFVPLYFASAISVTLMMSRLSWILLERPFVAYKSRYAR